MQPLDAPERGCWLQVVAPTAEDLAALRNEAALGLPDCQKSLTYFATGMGANELLLDRLQRVPALRLGTEDQELLADVRVEVRPAIEMVDISDNILSQMMDAFAAIPLLCGAPCALLLVVFPRAQLALRRRRQRYLASQPCTSS